MATLTNLPREVLKWLLSLDLSYPVRNVKRDFANGFLFAEVLSRYYPSDIEMHSLENVTSTELKRANWVVLEKLFKKRSIPVEPKQIEAVMSADGDAASEVLQLLYAFINSDAYTSSLAATSTNERPTAARDGPGGAYGFTPEQAAMVAWQQQMFFQQQVAAAEGLPPASKKKHIAAVAEQLQATGVADPALAQQLGALLGGGLGGGGVLGGGGGGGGGGGVIGGVGGGAAVPDELAYSKKPRPVQYRPYGMRDYEERAYDVKQAPGYWQLGRLGPENENAELQAKRENSERIKQLSRQINATNQQRLSSAASIGSAGRGSARGGGGGSAGSMGSAGVGGGSVAGKEQSARERAVEYAKASVPRPEPARKKPHSPAATGSGPVAAAVVMGGVEVCGPASASVQRLERLQRQHEADSQAVEAIRREMERSKSKRSTDAEGGATGRTARAAPAAAPKAAEAARPARRTGSRRSSGSRGSDGGRGGGGGGGDDGGGSGQFAQAGTLQDGDEGPAYRGGYEDRYPDSLGGQGGAGGEDEREGDVDGGVAEYEEYLDQQQWAR